MSSYEPLYIDYLIYFNRDQDYFECHEVLEELWLERNHDPLYKGLLQIAVGLYHYRNGNLRGGGMMLQSSLELLEVYPDISLGIQLGALKADVRKLVRELQENKLETLEYRDLSILIEDQALVKQIQTRSLELKPNVPQRRSPTRGRIYEEKMKALQQAELHEHNENANHHANN
jgi:predicted metal-dependent hydrolase